MKQNKLDLIVTFAKMWGIATVEDYNNEKEIYGNLEAYDAEELTKLLSAWADEFIARDYDSAPDTGEFFDEKISSLISSFTFSPTASEHPVLYGYAGEITKELKSVQEVAEFIIEFGQKNDVVITRDDDTLFLNTFGNYINRIVDMEYREALLKVLVPMQQAIDGSSEM